MNEEKLLTPKEWQKETGITIIDPDGWRGGGGLTMKDFNKKISKREFCKRALPSTIQMSAKAFKSLEEKAIRAKIDTIKAP